MLADTNMGDLILSKNALIIQASEYLLRLFIDSTE